MIKEHNIHLTMFLTVQIIV